MVEYRNKAEDRAGLAEEMMLTLCGNRWMAGAEKRMEPIMMDVRRIRPSLFIRSRERQGSGPPAMRCGHG
jgi:hypothetical protein